MISRNVIARIRARTDLVPVVAEWTELVRRERSLLGLCPICHQKAGAAPTFHVNAERQSFHCFACKASGGAIEFVMKLNGCSFVAAARALGERAGIDVVETLTD
jgi:DNA primase